MGNILFAELTCTNKYGIAILQEWQSSVLGITDSEPPSSLSPIIPALDDNAASSSINNHHESASAASSPINIPPESAPAASSPINNPLESSSPASPAHETFTADDVDDWFFLDEEEDGDDTMVYCLLDFDRDWVKIKTEVDP